MQLPDMPVREAILRSYAGFLTQAGGRVAERPLVLPTGKFFPDSFHGDQPSLDRLLTRMLSLVSMEDVRFRAELTEGAPGGGGGGCGSGACGPGAGPSDGPRLRQEDGTWVVRVPPGELGNPTVLTSNLARIVGHVFALDVTPETPVDELPLLGELAAVSLGLGLLVLQGSYVYAKSCGGPSIGQVTAMSCPEAALSVAAFLASSGTSPRAALKHCEITQRTLLKEACGFVASNPDVTKMLRDAPARLASANLNLVETQPWLVRILGRRPSGRTNRTPETLEEMEAMAAAAAPQTPSRDQAAASAETDSLRALVDEAFGTSAPPRSDADA